MGRAVASVGPGRLFGSRREWLRDLAVAGMAGLFLGLVGPFGSYLNESRTVVLLYWIGSLLFGAVLFGLTLRPAIQLAPRLRIAPTGLVLVVLLMAAMPLALICHAVAGRLWPVPVARIGIGLWYAQTLVISAPLAIGYWLAATLRREPPPETTESSGIGPDCRAGQAGSSFMTRLPPGLGHRLVALQMEDHYVRAHTAAGSALILIPLHQAISELTCESGLRTHRSWWVARSEVTGTVRDGRNLRLSLSNGIEAPVSRTNIATVREAGLL